MAVALERRVDALRREVARLQDRERAELEALEAERRELRARARERAAAEQAASRALVARQRARKRRASVVVPSEEAGLRIAESASYERFRAMILIAMYSGLRLHECAALEVRDVRVLENGNARLSLRVQKGGGTGECILFEPGVWAALSVAPPVGGLILRNAAGLPYTRHCVADLFRATRERAGVPYCTFHHLRHFHAAWLLDQGFTPIDVGVQLRHSARDNGMLVQRLYGQTRSQRLALARLEAVKP